MAAFERPTFVPPLLITPSRPGVRHAGCAERRPRLQASAKPPEIPSGAQIESISYESALSRRLSNLRFGYESPNDPSPSQLSVDCKLRYRCAQGHVVCAKPGSPACRFCPTCRLQMSDPSVSRRGRRLSLCEVQAVALLRGGSLVSTEYKDSHTPLVWKCAEGHFWKAKLRNIRNGGTWCPECARQRKKLTMDDMHQLARSKGGQCLSSEYISEYVKLKWRCKEGHEFLLEPNNMRRKPNGARKSSWCKICQKKKTALDRKEKARARAESKQLAIAGVLSK